jgi:hypothetical protein
VSFLLHSPITLKDRGGACVSKDWFSPSAFLLGTCTCYPPLPFQLGRASLILAEMWWAAKMFIVWSRVGLEQGDGGVASNLRQKRCLDLLVTNA